MWSLKLNYSESCRLACWYSLYSMFIDAHNVFDILSICQPTIHSHNFLIYRLLYIYFLQIDSVGRRFRMIHDFVWEEMSLKKLKFLLFCLICIYITHVLVVDKFTNICPSERRQRMEGDETRSIRHPDGLFRQWPASHLRRCAQQRCRLVRL